MNTLTTIIIAKIGLKIARVVVKLSPTKTDDKILDVVDQTYSIVNKLKQGDFNVETELDTIGDAVIAIRDSYNQERRAEDKQS